MKLKKRTWLKIILLLAIVLVTLYFLYVDDVTEYFAPDQAYLDNQLYCVKDADCVNNLENCQINDVLNCRNKYYGISDEAECVPIDLGITDSDKCLCNEETNNCEIKSE